MFQIKNNTSFRSPQLVLDSPLCSSLDSSWSAQSISLHNCSALVWPSFSSWVRLEQYDWLFFFLFFFCVSVFIFPFLHIDFQISQHLQKVMLSFWLLKAIILLASDSQSSVEVADYSHQGAVLCSCPHWKASFFASCCQEKRVCFYCLSMLGHKVFELPPLWH